MKAVIIIQPIRFQIVEEIGCTQTVYSYVAYIIEYVPNGIASLGCVILARKFSHDDNNINNTLTVFYSSHSSDFADIPKTAQGEERILVERSEYHA